eukprot:358754-Prymnesium_polylepis.1
MADEGDWDYLQHLQQYYEQQRRVAAEAALAYYAPLELALFQAAVLMPMPHVDADADVGQVRQVDDGDWCTRGSISSSISNE